PMQSGSGRDEFQRDAVEAMALAGGRRAVVEDMPQMPAAAAAMAFRAHHEQRGVLGRADGAGQGLPEARPTRAAVELGVRGIEFLAAAGAGIDPRLVELVERRAEGAFGAVLAQDVKLLLGQPLTPFVIRQRDRKRLLGDAAAPGKPYGG